jgi:alpha-glucosidase (family GH31 glycosyl hydrolase)
MIVRLLLCAILLVSPLSAQTSPGDVTGFTRDGDTIRIYAGASEFRLTFYAVDVLRVDFLPSPLSALDSSFVVIRAPAHDLSLSVRDTDSMLVITSSQIQVQCRKHPLRFSFADSSGRILLKEPAEGGMAADHAERRLRFCLNANEHFYGTGERGTRLDKRGLAFESYNTQVGGYSTPLATMNLNVPFLASSRGYALYVDNVFRGRYDLGASDTGKFSYTATGGELSWYLLAAPTIPEQVNRYTWLTGRQPLPPRWAFGYIQSKNRYHDEAEARSIVRTLREKQIPCDGLVLDLAWFVHMGDVSWDTTRWPRHDAMISEFLAQGIKTILITEPYIVQPSHNFGEAESHGYLAKDSAGHIFLLDKWWSCGGCTASLLDLTNPEVQRWWWEKHSGAFSSNVAGIWTDLGEPERHPEEMVHHLGSASKIHNIFNLLWARTIFDGFKQMRPGERVVNLTRSGFAGIQRYGVLPWSGDVARSFGGLEVQMPMMLNMGLSGLAYHNSDIGGYARMPTTPELYVRWMQYGVFCPITRAHGAGETVHGSPTEPWQFGAQAETICRDYLRLRYRLLPYIYTLAYRNYESGLPLARPLFFLDPGDTTLFNESSSYLWGESFLVSPIVGPGQTTKSVYLPRGTWVNFWTDEVVQGGRHIVVHTPLERMPLFVRAGSIIPMAPAMNYSDERPLDTLTLCVYPADTGEAIFSLYEDDGKSLEYQEGKHSFSPYTCRSFTTDTGPALKIVAGRSQGSFAGKVEKRTNIFEIHGVSPNPARVRCNGAAVAERTVPGRSSATAPAFWYEATARTLSIQVVCDTDSSYDLDILLR